MAVAGVGAAVVVVDAVLVVDEVDAAAVVLGVVVVVVVWAAACVEGAVVEVSAAPVVASSSSSPPQATANTRKAARTAVPIHGRRLYFITGLLGAFAHCGTTTPQESQSSNLVKPCTDGFRRSVAQA